MSGSFNANLAAMRDVLSSSRNDDGGWAYYAGRASRLEATCWALLALHRGEAAVGPGVSLPLAFFHIAQSPDGLFNEPALRAEGRSNLGFNGLAATVLATHSEAAPDSMLPALVGAILAHTGIKLPQSDLSPQDNSLQGWAWIDETFSWVEPTSWCLLGLKKAGAGQSGARARIEEAERLLRDRCCRDGGWNAGTAEVLGQGLKPFVPTTALGLIALQDQPHDPVVVRGLASLAKLRVAERSSMALSLTLIALNLFDRAGDAAEVREALAAQWDRTRFLGNLHLTAMALYALTSDDHGTAAFRI